MDSFFDNAERAQRVVTIIVFMLIAVGVWFGRKRLWVTIPLALFVFFLAAMIIPSAIGARQAAGRNACFNNLQLIREAKKQWAEESHKQPTDTPTDNNLFGPSRPFPSKPVCPIGGTYTLGTLSENPTCSLANRGHKLE